jgi:hypothetical protein
MSDGTTVPFSVMLTGLFWSIVRLSDDTTVPDSVMLTRLLWGIVRLSDRTTFSHIAVPLFRYTQTSTQIFL